MSHKLNSLKTQRVAANHSIDTLAKKANVGDGTIVTAEMGGNIGVDPSQRIADALGVSLVTLGKEDY